MQGLKIENGLYIITCKSKIAPREFMQIHKLNRNRELGGLSIIAYNINQVLEYATQETSN